MASALDSGSSGTGSSPAKNIWIVFFGKTIFGTSKFNVKVTTIPSRAD